MKIFVTRSGKHDSLEDVRIFTKDCSGTEAADICKDKTCGRGEKYWSITNWYSSVFSNIQFENNCPTEEEWDNWENEYGQ